MNFLVQANMKRKESKKKRKENSTEKKKKKEKRKMSEMLEFSCSTCKNQLCSLDSSVQSYICSFCNERRTFCSSCKDNAFLRISSCSTRREFFCSSRCSQHWTTKTAYLTLELAFLFHDDEAIKKLLFDPNIIYAPSYLDFASSLVDEYNRSDIKHQLRCYS
jgi:hypothetical protein